MILSKLKSNFFAEQERWFLWIPVLFGMGISFYFSLFSEPPAWLLLTVFEILVFGIYLLRKKASALIFLSSFLVFLLGILCIKAHTTFQAKQIAVPNQEETIYLKGTILQTDTNNKGKTRLWLDDVFDYDNLRKGIYRITISGKNQSFQTGDCVEMAATVNAPSQAMIPNGFQFNRQAFYQGISAIGYNESNVYRIDCEKKPSFYTYFKNKLNITREHITFFIQKTLPTDDAAIAAAILVGNKNLISENLYQQYREAGLAHFLSISGLHMGLIAAFAFVVIRFLMALIPYLSLHYSSKKWAASGAIFLSLIYLLFSGTSIPAARAFLMTSIVFIGILLDREAISMRTVAFAALVILIIKPYVLLTPGFQMSFAAVTALVAFYETFSKKFNFHSKNYFLRILLYVTGICLTTFIATLATLPFCLYHFGILTPYALLGNVLATPIIAFIVMPFIFLSFLLYPFALAFGPLKIAGIGLNIINKITYFVSHLAFAGIHFSTPPLWAVIIVVLGGLWLALWKLPWRYIGIFPILIGLCCFTLNPSPTVLYSADGQNVGLPKNQNELIIFTSQKNNFLNQIWNENKATLQIEKNLKSIPQIDLICLNDKCTYQNFFSFDLKGYISFKNKRRDPQSDLGGAIYLSKNAQNLLTVRQTIGVRPWNK